MIDINKLQKSIENDKILYAGSNQGKKIYDQIKQKQMHYHSEEYLVWMNSSLFGWKEGIHYEKVDKNFRNAEFYLDWVQDLDNNLKDNGISVDTLIPYNELFIDVMSYRWSDKNTVYSRWGLFKYHSSDFFDYVNDTNRLIDIVTNDEPLNWLPDFHKVMSALWGLFELGHNDEIQQYVPIILKLFTGKTEEERIQKFEHISSLYDKTYDGVPLGPWKETYRCHLSLIYLLCQSYRAQNKWKEFKLSLDEILSISKWVGSSGNYYLQGNRVRELLFMVWDNERTEENKQKVFSKHMEQLEWGWCYEYTDCLFESVINSLNVLIKMFEYDG